MTKQALTAAQMQPLQKNQNTVTTALAGQGYWQRVWTYLKADKTSMLALALLVVLLLGSFLGHHLWRQDPNLQNSVMRFVGATPSYSAVLISDSVWQPTGHPTAFEVVAANTQFVRLQWPESMGQNLSVYRKLATQAEGYGRLVNIPQAGYAEDRFELKATTYIYSLVDANGQLLDVLQVAVPPSVSRFYAEMTGLIAIDSGQQSVLMPAHPLGTDGLGRDTLARLIAGGQITLGIGIVAPLLATLFGLFSGALSGYVGGRTDEIMMRFADFVIALPFLLFVILLNVALGYGPQSSGVFAMFVALTIMGWPNCAKLVRGQVLMLRESAYIDAAKLMGGSSLYIIRVHILPSVLGAVLVALSFAIPSAIFTEALLSFIGLGVKAPVASWGSMCQEAINELQRHPMQLVYPAALISLTVLAFNMLGDSLRDALASAGGQHD